MTNGEIMDERPATLTAMMTQRLRAAIIDGSIPLGSMLSEKVLAESHGVSKTPVREALVQLQTQGLVTILPQRGGRVFKPDAEQVRELCEVRLALESTALRMSMERNRAELVTLLDGIADEMEECFDLEHPAHYQQLDSAFHNALFVHAGNALLADAYRMFDPRISVLRTHVSQSHAYLLRRSLDEHRLLVELVAADNLDDALQLIGEHISRTRDVQSRLLRDSAD